MTSSIDKGYWVCDLESNNLLSGMLDYSSFPYKLNTEARLWCVVLRNIHTNEVRSASLAEVTKEWMQKNTETCKYFVTHNGLKFDLLVLKLFGVLEYRVGYIDEEDTLFGRPVVFIDTLIYSRLFNPDRYDGGIAGHSLDAWGQRLGESKTDFRQVCIDLGVIEKSSPKFSQFAKYIPEMLEYCKQDTLVTAKVWQELNFELESYPKWSAAIKVENKLADLAVRRENLGFWFDKDLAIKLLADLQEKMQVLQNKVNPLLPPKPRNKGELTDVTPPASQLKVTKAVYLPKIQLKKDGTPSAAVVKFLTNQECIDYKEGSLSFWFNCCCYELPYTEALVPEQVEPSDAMLRFAEKVGGSVEEIDGEWLLFYKGQMFPLPYNEALETHVEADISQLDHVKSYLIELGWQPLEFSERDLTKDSKKRNLSIEKRIQAFDRWYEETIKEGKYKKDRLEILGIKEEKLYSTIKAKLSGNRPVRVPLNPPVRVGVEKELCPNLVKMGEKVSFANDFALFLTYKHRRSSIAGGDIEDMDFEVGETPNSGYLNQYRNIDGRIPCPAIELGAVSSRFKHIGITNIPRVTSVYGGFMRALFGCGAGKFQAGGDFSALEARLMGNRCWNRTLGKELAALALAPKPNDFHQVTADKIGISRADAKSLNYAVIYGCSPQKITKMLGIPLKDAKKIYDDYWKSVPALKELKDDIEKAWVKNGKTYIKGLDGRKLHIRSSHSALNLVFQSDGAICVRYTSVFMCQYFEKLGYCIDPFIAEPDLSEMITMHDEFQYYISKKLIQIKKFETEEEAKEFKANWTGEQLGEVSHGKSWYIIMPNVFSQGFVDSIRKTEKLLKLNVNLEMNYTVSNNWEGTH